jgi:uncharacterized RDD family membrane protein YckC
MSDDQQSQLATLLNRLVGSVVSPVVDSVDVDHLVERIDVNDVVSRVDLEAMIAGLDLNEILDRIDPDRLLDRVDPDRLLDRVDPDRLLDRVDPDRLLDRLDPDRLLDRLDLNRLLDRLDVDRLIARIDVDAVVQRVDLDAVIDTVDLNRVIGRIDLDDAVDRIDLNRALDRVDLNAVVERTELGSIIARSTTGVFGQLLDAARTQVMGVDQVAQAGPARVLRRNRREIPPVPEDAPKPTEVSSDRFLTSGERAVTFQGRYAGSVSRFLAFVVDQFAIGTLFGLGALLVSAAFTVVVGTDFTLSENRVAVVIAYGVWAFVYYAATQAATGRTIGKAIAGILVVDAAGKRLSGKAAVVRTLVFPISFVLFGVGLLVGLFRQDRRELHDLLAGTGVVYQWDAALAERRVIAA